MGQHRVDVYRQRKAYSAEVQRLLQAVESAMEGSRHFHHCPGPDGFQVLLNGWSDYRSPVVPAGSTATSPGD